MIRTRSDQISNTCKMWMVCNLAGIRRFVHLVHNLLVVCSYDGYVHFHMFDMRSPCIYKSVILKCIFVKRSLSQELRLPMGPESYNCSSITLTYSAVTCANKPSNARLTAIPAAESGLPAKPSTSGGRLDLSLILSQF